MLFTIKIHTGSDAFDQVKEITGEDPLEVFDKAMNNIMPTLEVKARRVGGANYQVPMEVRPERRQTLGLRWLTNYTRARGEKTMSERLAKELLDAADNTGARSEEHTSELQSRHNLVCRLLLEKK